MASNSPGRLIDLANVEAVVAITADHVRVFWADGSAAYDFRDRAAIDVWEDCIRSGHFEYAAGGMSHKSQHLVRRAAERISGRAERTPQSK